MAAPRAGQQAAVTSILIRQGAGAACAWDGGEDMTGIVDVWSSGGRDVKAMQDASAILLKNPKAVLNSRALNRASQVMGAVSKAKPVDVLYRGMGISKAEAAGLMKQAGKKVALPLTSATYSPDIATQFSQRVRGLPTTTDMHLVTEIRGARAYPIADMVPDQFAYQSEVIIQGNFRVIEVTQDGDQLRMVMEAI